MSLALHLCCTNHKGGCCRRVELGLSTHGDGRGPKGTGAAEKRSRGEEASRSVNIDGPAGPERDDAGAWECLQAVLLHDEADVAEDAAPDRCSRDPASVLGTAAPTFDCLARDDH